MYTNQDILRITGCMSISRFAEKQQLKWLAHCVRMENDELQKITLFTIPTKPYFRDVWNRVEGKTGMSRQQFWKMAQDKSSFNSYIEHRYGSFNG